MMMRASNRPSYLLTYLNELYEKIIKVTPGIIIVTPHIVVTPVYGNCFDIAQFVCRNYNY